MNKGIYIVAILIALAGFVGCGGSGTGNSNSTVNSISGKVADGYLVGATVFLDKNENYQLDAGESFTTTDTNGAYSLTVDPTEIGKYPLVVLVMEGVTIDKDTNQPVTDSYILSMPKGRVSGTVNSNFISPMSSILREMMETGLYATIPQAMEALRVKTGSPAGSDIMADFLANNDSALHSTAQNMARVMGNQRALIINTDQKQTVVDVDRYRGMMGTIFNNMSSIKGSNSNAQFGMSHLTETMSTVLSHMPPTSKGKPFQNMSSAFRTRMVKHLH